MGWVWSRVVQGRWVMPDPIHPCSLCSSLVDLFLQIFIDLLCASRWRQWRWSSEQNRRGLHGAYILFGADTVQLSRTHKMFTETNEGRVR